LFKKLNCSMRWDGALLSLCVALRPTHGVVHASLRPAMRTRRGVAVASTPRGVALRAAILAVTSGDEPLERGLGASDAPAITKSTAFLLLNGVACVWGTQHPIIKQCVDAAYAQSHSDLAAAAELNFGRFAIGALLFAPFLPPLPLPAQPRAELPAALESEALLGWPTAADDAARASWRYGAELAVWMFGGFALQAIGLGSTTASRSAFLLYLNVKLVPIISSVVYRTPVAPTTWLSALVAFAGTALLAFDGSPPNRGDGWSILAAITSAVFILRLQAASAACADSRALNAVTLLVVAALSSLACGALALARADGDALAALEGVGADLGALGAERVLYLGVVCTGLCNWAQTVGQRAVRAEEAAIVYATDPLWSALFSFLALGETLGTRGWAGAALILSAALGSQLVSLSTPAEAAVAEAAGVDLARAAAAEGECASESVSNSGS
jgi:drug/metabolite transporter (DMT)-like permease